MILDECVETGDYSERIKLAMTTDKNSKFHIMLVEDDASLSDWIADYLTKHDYCVTVASRGDKALELIRSDEPDLVVLDVMLPGVDGLNVCRLSREFYKKPILMLTALGSESDEVMGLDTGADDYLSKPVRPKILLARINALLRRDAPDSEQLAIGIGALFIDPVSRNLTLNDEAVPVSSHEFDLLTLLARSAGTPVSRDILVTEMRGIEYNGLDRSIDISISRLRKKLGDDASAPTRIKTVRGKGYLLAPDAW